MAQQLADADMYHSMQCLLAATVAAKTAAACDPEGRLIQKKAGKLIIRVSVTAGYLDFEPFLDGR